mgnify:CR=1 FL=1
MATVTVTRPTRRRPRFYRLRVREREWLTSDAIAVTFDVPTPLREAFAFRAGQHVTIRWAGPDGEVRRSYSVCSTPRELARSGRLRIGIRLIPGGVFSEYARQTLAVGDEIDVMPPLGGFTTDFDPQRSRHYGAIVAGSGITPVLSLVATALETENGSRFTIIFGNRTANSVMFVDELADLKDRYPARLHIVHVLSRESRDAELLTGRLDAERISRLLDALLPTSDPVDEWFLCGPYGVVEAAQSVLSGRGVPRERIHLEFFFVGDDISQSARATEQARDITEPDEGDCVLTVRLGGRITTLRIGRRERLLDRIRRERPETPFSCTGGVCGTCRARVTAGRARMERCYALTSQEVAEGFILTCQTYPVTDALSIDYDV